MGGLGRLRRAGERGEDGLILRVELNSRELDTGLNSKSLRSDSRGGIEMLCTSDTMESVELTKPNSIARSAAQTKLELSVSWRLRIELGSSGIIIR